MNRVHPLYALLLAAAGLLFLSWQLHLAKAAYARSNAEFKTLEATAEQIGTLRKTLGNAADLTASLQSLLQRPQLSDVKSTVQTKGRVWSLSAEALGRQEAQYLLGQLLNLPCDVRTLTLEKAKNDRVNLHIEVAL